MVLSCAAPSSLAGVKAVGNSYYHASVLSNTHIGAPLELCPHEDDKDLANDPKRNNNFVFNRQDQTRCPYSAHIRKTNPRDKEMGEQRLNETSIVRAGIAYSPGKVLCVQSIVALLAQRILRASSV